MSNLAKLEFMTLDIMRKNYLLWILDAKIHLDAIGLDNVIKERTKTSEQDKVKAMIFLRRNLHEGLKIEISYCKRPFCIVEKFKRNM